MSLIHKIKSEQKYDKDMIVGIMQGTVDNLRAEIRGENVVYLYIDNKSTRGVDLTFEDYGYEIRNTILSSEADYNLTNLLIEVLLNITDGILMNEDDEPIDGPYIYDGVAIKDMVLHDAQSIVVIAKENNEVAIYGPVRKTHFGKRLGKELEPFLDDLNTLSQKVFDIILNVQYGLPDYEYGNIMAMNGNVGEKEKILKLITDESDYLIDKYDYILLNGNKEEPIVITNEILNSMLPVSWKLVDEFTIVAPRLNQTEYKKLIESATPFDMFNDLVDKK